MQFISKIKTINFLLSFFLLRRCLFTFRLCKAFIIPIIIGLLLMSLAVFGDVKPEAFKTFKDKFPSFAGYDNAFISGEKFPYFTFALCGSSRKLSSKLIFVPSLFNYIEIFRLIPFLFLFWFNKSFLSFINSYFLSCNS